MIIQHKLHPHLLPLAVANMDAFHKRYDHEDRLKLDIFYDATIHKPTFFSGRLKDPSMTSALIRMSHLLQIGCVHDCIDGLAKDYVRATVTAALNS